MTPLRGSISNSPCYPSNNLSFNIGDYVYAIQNGTTYYSRAIVISKSESIYTIQFDNGTIQTANIADLLIYFPCNCTNGNNNNIAIPNSVYLSKGVFSKGIQSLDCSLPLIILEKNV